MSLSSQLAALVMSSATCIHLSKKDCSNLVCTLLTSTSCALVSFSSVLGLIFRGGWLMDTSLLVRVLHSLLVRVLHSGCSRFST